MRTGWMMWVACLGWGCGPIAGDFGAPCAANQDCTTGACLTQFSGGYCSQRCENEACPSGARCAALQSGSYCLQDCLTSLLDCRSGYHCADVSGGSVCYPDCSQDAECGPGATCAEQRCVPGVPGPVGAACALNVGCASGRCEITYNGGYCTSPCAQEGPGAFNQGCVQGVCAKVSEAGGLCLASCTSDAACRQDYFCDNPGPSGACRPRCRGATHCALGFTCDVGGGGRCIEGSALPRETGAPCGTDGDCNSGYCLDQPNQQFPKGICSADCTADPSSCGTSGLCIVPANAALASVCLQQCKTNFDCRADYFCSEVAGATERVCIPRCTAVPMCSTNTVCDPYSGDCVAPMASGTTHIQRVSVGQLPLSPNPAQGHFTLAVPNDGVSFTVVMKGDVGGTSAISRLIDPTGDVLFDLDHYLTSKVRILPVNDGDFGMLFPNSPRVPLRPGNYQFTIVNEDGEGTGEVFALVKTSSTGRISSGALNINFWFAGMGTLNATTAGTDAAFQQALTEFRALYATAGITLGKIAYFDVPASQAAVFSVIDSTDGKDSELRRLFQLSAGAPNNAMNMFLVREIKGGGYGYTILGIAGGIPGIPFEQGTNASGVAVTALDLAADPKSVARTMAHEGGHWLGLWHTTEQKGQLHDPLSDTPECSADRDTNQDGLLSSSECAGAGANNLMFWQAGAFATQLSANQGYVLLRNPVVTSQ